MADYSHAQEAVEEPIQASKSVETDDMGGTLDEKYTEDDSAAPPAGRDPEKQAKMEKLGTNDKYEITEDDCYDELGYSYSNKKKWYILTIIFIVQVSMNFNTSLYGNAIGGISTEFNVSKQGARVGAAIFLILYAFGCELWVSRDGDTIAELHTDTIAGSLVRGVWSLAHPPALAWSCQSLADPGRHRAEFRHHYRLPRARRSVFGWRLRHARYDCRPVGVGQAAVRRRVRCVLLSRRLHSGSGRRRFR